MNQKQLSKPIDPETTFLSGRTHATRTPTLPIRRIGVLFSLLFTLVLLAGAATQAASVRLTWSPNNEPTVAGYKVYQGGASGEYDTIVDVGMATEKVFTGLTKGATYHFSVTAYDAEGYESDRSDEVVFVATDAVAPKNRAPQSVHLTFSVPEDGSVAVTLQGSDPDNDPLQWRITRPPAHGALAGTPPSLVYSPAANYHGADSFQYTVSDGKAESGAATVSITVTPVNDAPTAAGASVTTLQDQPVGIALKGADVDGDPLTFSIVTPPTRGSLSGSAPQLVYTPAPGVSGTDSFTFRAHDGKAASSPATVSITITAAAPAPHAPDQVTPNQPTPQPNRAPVATAQSVVVTEDSSVYVPFGGTDPDGDPITFTVVQGPKNGRLTGAYPKLVYEPSPNYHGEDTVLFTATDGRATSAPATVTIKVLPINDPPVANNASLVTADNVDLPVTLSATDIDGDTLSYSIVQGPANGTLSGTAPNLVYRARAGFSGTDRIIFSVTDSMRSATGEVTISVTASRTNKAPTAQPASLTVAQDASASIVLKGSDPDGDSLTFKITSAPAHGALSGTAPNLTYKPASGYSGADAFSFTVSDGKLSSAPATVAITVTKAANRAPVAKAATVSLDEDSTVAIKLQATDPDGDKLTYSIVTPPVRGRLSGSAPNLTYTPNKDYHGTDSFAFKVSDGKLSSGVATVTINVAPVNDEPQPRTYTVKLKEDSSIAFNLEAHDPDATSLTWKITRQPEHGVLHANGRNLRYVPHKDFHGSDSLQFTVSDGIVTSAPQTMPIIVTPVNDAPVANAATVEIRNGKGSIVLAGTDVDGDALSFKVTRAPAHGTLTGTAPNLTYTAKKGYSGTDTLQFTVSDAEFTSAPATVTIKVSGSPKPLEPMTLVVAQGDAAVVTRVNPSAPMPELTVAPRHGVVEMDEAGAIRYRHLGADELTDTFTFVSSDEQEQVVNVRLFKVLGLRPSRASYELDVAVAADVEYVVEMSDASSVGGAEWKEMARFIADADGIATITDTLPAPAIGRLYRVVCRSTAGDLVSSLWGRRKVRLRSGASTVATPFEAALIARSQISQLGTDRMELEGTRWSEGQLQPRNGVATHMVRVVDSPNAAAIGKAWPILSHTDRVVVLATGGTNLASLLADGAIVEVTRLATIADMFGNGTSSSCLLAAGESITGSTAQGSSMVVGRLGAQGYFTFINGRYTAPLDGTTLGIEPGMAVTYVGFNRAALEYTASGRLPATATTW